MERGKIVLAEFTYGGKLAPSFPTWLIDGTRPSRAAWILKERFLPPLYWQAMLQGPRVDGAARDGRLMMAGAARRWRRWLPSLPILDWGRRYNRDTLVGDAVAALIVTIMLIPQSLAYALLAGLPPEVGLYASVAPLLLYALFGSSRALAVGPVAVVSLMTAAAIGEFAAAGSPAYWTAALTLAFLSGAMLLLMGVLRLGFLANFLSHPVISGFISASGLIIAASQLKTLLGVKAEGHNLLELLSVAGAAGAEHPPADAGHRRGRHRLPVLGAQGSQAAAHRLGHEAHGRPTSSPRPGRWRRSP